jgi:fatty-acyl-CoA synthase
MINSSNGEETAPSGVVRFNDFIANSDITVDAVEAVSQPDDSINIQFTSGTTGNPKAATLTHHNIVQNAQFVAKRMLEGMSDPPSLCLPNPLYHCFGSVIGSIVVAMKRGSIVLPAPVFNATKTLETIHNYK